MNGVTDRLPPPEAIRTLIETGTFEETLSALEIVVEHLEHGRLTMEESITWYEAGLGLQRRCSYLIEQAELRISALDGANPEGVRTERTLGNEQSWDNDGS